jgi:ATP-dependent Clp protease ATP-binding subunit ClpC
LLADRFPDKTLTAEIVTDAFTRETGLPRVLIDDDVPLPLDKTEAWFARRVIGQPEAVRRIPDLLATVKARLARPRQPLASLLLIGPTGTGKTELAKALAEFLFGDVARLSRFDLSEFSDPWSVQRLIGVGPTEGLLTARIREQPFSVLLLDEFEKADSSFFDLLLQILGDGRLTDAAGRVADFCNAVIVMTSNLGAQSFQRGAPGFRHDRTGNESAEHFDSAVRNFLRPEIYNRIDAIVPFHPLDSETVRHITERQLDLIRQRDGLRLRQVELELAPQVAEHLAKRGYEPRYGARPLKRTIERELLLPLAEALTNRNDDVPLQAEAALDGTTVSVNVRSLPQRARKPPEITVFDIVRERRCIQRLQRCAVMQRFENETSTLASLTRRVDRARHPRPDDLARLNELRKLRRLLEAVTDLSNRAQSIEGDTLSDFYAHEPADSETLYSGLNLLRRDREKLTREALRLSCDDPDTVVLAIFSEHREWLFKLIHAYLAFVEREKGKLRALDYFTPPPKRTSTSQPAREHALKPASFFEKPPAHVIGVVLHLGGDLFWPRFNGEAGLHILRIRDGDRICLVDVSQTAFADYTPPSRIDRAGTIAALGASERRTFEREDIAPVLAMMLDDALNSALEALLN